jgi:hypothetical protein
MILECPSEVPPYGHDLETCPFLPSLSELEFLKMCGLHLLSVSNNLVALSNLVPDRMFEILADFLAYPQGPLILANSLTFGCIVAF